MQKQQLYDSITRALQQLIDWKVDFTDKNKLVSILKDAHIDKDDRQLLENALVNMNAYNLLQQASSKRDAIEGLVERMKYVDKDVALIIIGRIAVMLIGFPEQQLPPPPANPQSMAVQSMPAKILIQSQQLQNAGFCVKCGTPYNVQTTFCNKCGMNLQSVQETEPIASNGDVRLGNIIHFGAYRWRIIDSKGNQALIITEDVIEQRAYNNQLITVTWEQCTLRKYLNSVFLNKLDGEIIASITNQNLNNSWYGTAGGNDTKDKIFLLSLDELCSSPYFGDSKLKLTEKGGQSYINDENNSKRAVKFNNVLCSWWLRSSGRNGDNAARVDDNGDVDVGGDKVNRIYCGVRPALWLNL
jgi:hypothetical protein